MAQHLQDAMGILIGAQSWGVFTDRTDGKEEGETGSTQKGWSSKAWKGICLSIL